MTFLWLRSLLQVPPFEDSRVWLRPLPAEQSEAGNTRRVGYCPLHRIEGFEYSMHACFGCQEEHFDYRQALLAGRDPALVEPCDCEVCELRMGWCAGCGVWTARNAPAGARAGLRTEGLVCKKCAQRGRHGKTLPVVHIARKRGRWAYSLCAPGREAKIVGERGMWNAKRYQPNPPAGRGCFP